jgi:hypothetical protein
MGTSVPGRRRVPFSLPLKGGGSGRGLREAYAVLVESQRTPTPTLPLKKGEGVSFRLIHSRGQLA